MKIDEEINYIEAIPDDLSSLGILYAKMGEAVKSIDFYQRAIAYCRQHNNEYTLLTVLINLGIQQKKMDQLKEAENTYGEALKIVEHVNNDWLKEGLFHNLGSLYNKKGDYQKALEYFNKSISLLTIADGQILLTANYAGMAESYQGLGNISKAIEFASKSLVLAQKIKHLEKMDESALLLSNLYRKTHSYERSLFYYTLHNSYKDSLFNAEKSKQLKELQTKYETENKEQKIVSLSHEKQLQDIKIRHKSTIQYITISSFVIFILFAMGFIRNRQLKHEGKRRLLAEQLKYEQVEAERLKELDQLKSRFFANVAHEFRTPLTLILGPVETMIAETKGHLVKNQLMLVKKNTSRLVQLVNQLLDLSKLEAGAVRVNLVSEDVMLFLKNHTYAFESLAEQQNIQLHFQSEINFLNMTFDKDKLEKILFNLLSNALKFTPPYGHVQVLVDEEKTGHGNSFERNLRVRVKDSGPGIPEEEISRVFIRFYQSNQVVSRTSQGSGIGLELTKELVEICGGQIHVKNNPEQGAEFCFTLPITEVTSSESEGSLAANLSTDNVQLDLKSYNYPGQSAPFESLKEADKEIILVVEDNTDVRNFIVNSLSSDYQIIQACDGEEGVIKALQHVPDLILSDVMMPKKDGFQVCKYLKEDEKTSHIPIILLTSKADVESKIEGLQQGADDYLAKPFHQGELLVRIKNLIEQRKLLREKYSNQPPLIKNEKGLPTKEQVFMKKLRGIIETHLPEEEYSVEELSAEMAMDRTQLFRKVKALTNGSISLYIRAVRLEHAYRLLHEGIYNVSEVAYRVGFNSSTYFSTCFTEQYGFPPSELRVEKGVVMSTVKQS